MILGGALSCLAATAPRATAQETTAHADLPYRIVPVPGMTNTKPLGTNRWIAFADLNGDGNPNAVLRHPLGLIGLSWSDGTMPVLFQHNLPVDSECNEITPSLGQFCDVTGSGTLQLPYIDRSRSTRRWSLRLYEPGTGEDRLLRELPSGRDVRPDGVWDGSYTIEATLPGGAPSGGPLLILQKVVRYDRYGRGVLGYDARADSTLWFFAMGPNPTTSLTLAGDLDGDGVREIIIAANSPDNLGGETVNGTSDDESFIFALEADGRLRWRYGLGGYYITPYLRLGDLDDDGRVELVAASACHATDPVEPDRLCRLSIADGAELDRIELPTPCQRLELQRPDPGDPPSVLLNGRNGRLYRIEMQDGRLGEPRLALPGSNYRLVGRSELTPESGRELLVMFDAGTDDVRLGILGADLDLLAERRLPPQTGGMAYAIWRVTPRQDIVLYAMGATRDAFKIEASPRPPWWERPGVAPTAGLGLGGLALLAWSASRRRQPGGPAAQGRARDQLLRLFRELEESSHGTLAATRGVERLVWLLEAYLNSGQPDGPVLDRLRQGVADFEEAVRPRLTDILAQARGAQLAGGAVRSTGKGLSDFEAGLAALDLQHPDLTECERALPQLQEASRRTVAGFRALREEVAACFSADPEAIVRGLLAQREPDAADVEMQFERTAAAAGGDLLCNIDAADLRFVLENLIDNALRAMVGAREQGPSGRLTVRFDREPGRVAIEVADTGCGVAPDARDRIFDPDFSSRPGGGLGLARSQEILAFWRGRMDLVESEPGHGSVFRVELVARRAHEPEGI